MEKHPIIANGELYAEPVSKAIPGGPKVLPHEYNIAKERIIAALDSLSEKISTSEEQFLEEKVVCIRLEPKFEAKSYMPQVIVNAMPREESQIVGGRKYKTVTDGIETSAKLYFVRTTDSGIRQLRTILQDGTKDGVEQWRQQIQSVNTIDLLTPEEKIMGFSDVWEYGTVEFVLHPLPSSTQKEIKAFFEHSKIDASKAKVKTYDDGITFISAECNQWNLQRAKSFNPLRAAHPLGNISITTIRNVIGSSCPSVSTNGEKPKIKVGVFDGGADVLHPLLNGYVKAYDATVEPPDQQYIAHGTGVCSTIMYGNLSGKNGNDVLETPHVMIDSYRVLPLHDSKDIDLYEVIDFIEKVVPNSKGTKLYNLSMGPNGAIIDDTICRFTYALDKLTYEVPKSEDNPLFVVAVGNDGQLPSPFNRIQSPADMVNGLGIGSYTYTNSGEKICTDYSCIGPGREGAKTKPDLLEFGGSIDRPFIIPSLDGKGLSAVAGTSFSAPLVTGKIGKLMSLSNKVSPQLARTLLIHNAEINSSIKSVEQGFGLCPDDISDILECSDKRVTIVYSGFIYPTQFLKLPIFLPKINEMQGNVSLSWTVATVVAPYCNDPDAYTNNCLEDVFTPNSMVFNFTKTGMKPQKINLLDPLQLPLVKELIDNGYKQSSTPVSHPAKKRWDEVDLRSADLKWDTIIHKELTMRSRSLFDPALTLHAIGRNGFENEEIRYFVVITIDAPKYKGSLYDLILQTYNNLVPIEVRNINRLMI